MKNEENFSEKIGGIMAKGFIWGALICGVVLGGFITLIIVIINNLVR